MTIPSEQMNPPAKPEDVDTSLLPPEARATVAEIKADNAAGCCRFSSRRHGRESSTRYLMNVEDY